MGLKCKLFKTLTFIFVLFLVLGISARVQAQQRSVRGKVTDGSNGELLPGVNITVAGTTTGTATNSSGEYTLVVP